MDRNNPRDYYGLFPDNLCEHGFNKLTCYPCAPLPEETKEGGTDETTLPDDMDSDPF